MKMTNKAINPLPVKFPRELLEQCPDCGSWGFYYEIREMMSASQQERQVLAKENLARLERQYKEPQDKSVQEDTDRNLAETYMLA